MKRFLNLFRLPAHTELRQRKLDEARRTLVEAAAQREYCAAMERMLTARIARLEREIDDER